MRAWFILLGVGVVAAMVTWTAGESLMRDETGMGSSRGSRIPISPVVYSTQNGMMSLGILGASLGLGVGLAGGMLRGSVGAGLFGGLLGLVLGGAAGAGAANRLVPYYFANYSGVSLSTPLIVHGGLWCSIAIASGLAFGIGLGGTRRIIETTLYAVVAALLATFVYEFASVWLFPSAQTDRPLPLSPGSRMFADLVIALAIGLSLAFAASQRRSTTVTQAHPTAPSVL